MKKFLIANKVKSEVDKNREHSLAHESYNLRHTLLENYQFSKACKDNNIIAFKDDSIYLVLNTEKKSKENRRSIYTSRIYIEKQQTPIFRSKHQLTREYLITEMITGLDLVELQYNTAFGSKMKEYVNFDRHSIEYRITTEDPEKKIYAS